MKRAMLLVPLLLLASCGTTRGDRALSGGMIGAGVGLVAGGVGVLAGALIGAGGGYVMKPEDVNLGKPVWRY